MRLRDERGQLDDRLTVKGHVKEMFVVVGLKYGLDPDLVVA